MKYMARLNFAITNRWRNWVTSRRLRYPIKSKYEIYELLLADETFIVKGRFRKSELSKKLFGHHTNDYKIYKKITNSLDWILDACIQDEEIRKVGNQNDDPVYEITGKGLNYFTLTKAQIKLEEANKKIQKSQINIQRWMLILTGLLVIGTFLANIGIEKLKELTKIIESLIILGLLHQFFN